VNEQSGGIFANNDISKVTIDEKYMHRCIELAKLAAGNVAPNPMVGAILVYQDLIIGEGYHEKYGGPHAEPNCIASVKEEDGHLVSHATMYVSLEPCAHFGKTPPCADLIIRNKIPKVVIGCRDPFREVDGQGIEKLQAAGIEIELGVLENECRELNKRFFTFHTRHRPYIILKWAETANGKIAAALNPPEERTANSSARKRLLISNEFTNRLVHKWRSEEAAILIGTNTALMDDPALTTRLWKGNDPIRLVVDMDLKLQHSLKIFNGEARTIIINKIKHEENDKIGYYQVTEDMNLINQIINSLYQLKILSVIVEGGARLLQSFIDEEMWDEARLITNEELITDNGLSAPVLSNQKLVKSQKLFSDQIKIYRNSIVP
jgi:diaminohydroxyphosphoribosylaminopyrimidine deaminase/5-amino-6-(5-phosphoribosylamino)uracil reductase